MQAQDAHGRARDEDYEVDLGVQASEPTAPGAMKGDEGRDAVVRPAGRTGHRRHNIVRIGVRNGGCGQPAKRVGIEGSELDARFGG